MSFTSRSITIAAAAVLLTLSTGCVSQPTYDKLDAAYRRSQEQLAAAQTRIAELEEELKLKDPTADREEVLRLRKERDDLQKQIDDLMAKYTALADRAGQQIVVQLDPETDKALREWAEQNADIAEYDAARGMVKLRSDLTFDLGSDVVKPGAQQTLARLAGVLTQGAAAKYEVRIVGHTDSVNITRAETLKNHKTNWHLGAHRAISVKDVLDKSGVPSMRIGIGSYGMYRPVAANAKGGTEANRRVEIYLVGMAPVNEEWLNSGGAAPAPAAAPAAPPK